MVYKVLLQGAVAQKAANPARNTGGNPSLFLISAPHSYMRYTLAQDQQFYIPSEGRSNG